MKKLTLKNSLSILMIILFSVILFAEEMTLQDIQKRAVESNLTISQLKSKIDAQSLQIKIEQNQKLLQFSLKSSMLYNTDVPEMNLGLVTKEIGTHERYDYYLQVQQLLWSGKRVSSQIKIAGLEKENLELEIKNLEDKVKFRCSQLYYQVLLKQKQAEITNESISRLDKQLIKIRQLYIEKQAIPQDTLDIANKKLELISVKNDLLNQTKMLLLELKELMNTNEDIQLKVVLNELSSLNTLAYYQQNALQQRVEFKQLKTRSDIITKQKDTIGSASLPQIYAFGELHYANPGMQQEEGWNPYASTGISFSWTPFDWKSTQHKKSQADHSLKHLKLEEQRLKNQINREIEQLYLNIEFYIQQSDLLDKLSQQEDLRYELTSKKYENQAVSNLDLLEVESRASEAKIKYEINQINIKLLYAQMAYYCGMEE